MKTIIMYRSDFTAISKTNCTKEMWDLLLSLCGYNTLNLESDVIHFDLNNIKVYDVFGKEIKKSGVTKWKNRKNK